MPLTIEDALRQLSIPDAPRRRRGIETALEYFRMRRVSEKKGLQILRAIDLSKKVKITRLGKGTIIAAFRRPKQNYGDFYTTVGTGPRALGIVVNNRKYVRYFVKQSVKVLESTTSAYQHESLGSGGGKQYYLPSAKQYINKVAEGLPRAER